MRTKPVSQAGEAFSLLEILVAMAVLVVIVLALATISSQTIDIWRSAEARNQRRSTGRALLQFIARDLEMATPQVPYPQTDGANLHFVANEPTLIPAGLLNPHAAFWQAPIAADRSKGDLAEIGYFVRWDTTSQPGTAKAQLCRFAVDPAESINYRIYSLKEDGEPANWLDADTLDRVASATAAQEYRGWFADNVIALWLRCLDDEGNPILKTAEGVELNNGYGFDSRRGFQVPSTGVKQPPPRFPASIEIALVTVDAYTAQRISQPLLANPDSPETFWMDKSTPGSLAHFIATLPPEVQPGVQVFSTRVVLKNSHP